MWLFKKQSIESYIYVEWMWQKKEKHLFWTECYCQSIFHWLYIYSYKQYKNEFWLEIKDHMFSNIFIGNVIKFKSGIF